MKEVILTPFKSATYLSQVRRLRIFATEALKSYPFRKYELKFINHGENSTFKVITSKKSYLLRIHRENYHTKLAIKEELKWLSHLNKVPGINVPKPVLGKNGEILQFLKSIEVGDRYYNLFEWKDGYIRRKGYDWNFSELGSLIGKLHDNPIASKHRKYWSSEGLIGKRPTMGRVDIIKKEYGSRIDDVVKITKKIKHRLDSYERKFPKKQSMIHADLHFRNIIWTKEGICPIDFDDCGIGPQIYDLAVPLNDISYKYKKLDSDIVKRHLSEFFKGYDSVRTLTKADFKILLDLLKVRDIAMLGWVYDRRDNPSIKKYLDKNFKIIVDEILDEDLYKFLIP